MPHRIIVVEATGNVFATGEPRPCLYTGIQTAASFDETIPTEILPTWLQDSGLVPRFDFMATTTFQTKKGRKRSSRKSGNDSPEWDMQSKVSSSQSQLHILFT